MEQQRSGPGPQAQRRQDVQRLGERRTRSERAVHTGASPSYAGHQAGIHPEDQPYFSEELEPQRGRAHTNIQRDEEEDGYKVEENEQYYVTQAPRSVVRWERAPQAPQVYTYGRRRVAVHQGPPPIRRQQLQQYADEYEEDEQEPIRGRDEQGREYTRSVHPLVWVGLCGIFLVVGILLYNMVGTWWQNTQNDWQYGKSRVSTADQRVGHNHDSSASPSHFVAQNSNGTIVITEWPAGDPSKAINYLIDTVPGNQGNPPVTLLFQDYNHDGKLDMLVQIGNPGQQITVILLNNGTKFVPETH